MAGIQTNLVINGGTITQNKIRDIKQLNAAQTVGAVGIDLAGGNNIVVTNNFVSDINHDMSGGFNNFPRTMELSASTSQRARGIRFTITRSISMA